MCSSTLKVVLLPGMDGTGKMFADFVKALPETFDVETVSYPVDQCLSYSELLGLVQSFVPRSERYVIVAESFSTPLAIQWAATNPPNLKGIVLCAGFVVSPVQGWLRSVCSYLAPLLFVVALPKSVARFLLVGSNASISLVATVRTAVSSVKSTVMSARLRAVLACDARAELAQVTMPILYLQATEDRLVNRVCVEEIRRIRPQTTVAAIAGPHLILQREPQLTAEVVVEFVRQLA
jgi:pimeloyl-[acyl-carrier protein] methyl ester esterase